MHQLSLDSERPDETPAHLPGQRLRRCSFYSFLVRFLGFVESLKVEQGEGEEDAAARIGDELRRVASRHSSSSRIIIVALKAQNGTVKVCTLSAAA